MKNLREIQPNEDDSAHKPRCGSWRLDREIGRGAYGVVYLAEGTDGDWVAAKVCRREDIGDERYERELRGAKLYSAIPPQEGLVSMLELAEEPWGFYAVMELADDEFGREYLEVEAYRPKNLASVIDSVKAMPLAECVKLGITLSKGLAALQQHHLLHRDIKPGNVLYVEGSPVLSDPGLVVETSEAVSCVGTQGYAPSEGFTNDTGDIFSLGQTLKAASFGRSVEDLSKGPSIEAETDSKFFNAWWRILNKATDEDHRRRYQSATALLKALENLRRKMSLASIVGSRAAKVTIALSVLAVVAIQVFFSVSSGRTRDALAKRSAENKALTDAIARQYSENRSLREDLAKRSAENKSLADDMVRQSAEIKALKEGLAKPSAEIALLREDFTKQSEENKALRGDFAKQSEENKSLRDDLAKRSAEIKALKQSLAKQTAEIAPLKEDLVRQSAENKSMIDALDGQSEENRSLKNDFAKWSEEIRMLKESLNGHSMGVSAQRADAPPQPVEVEQLRKEVEQLKEFKAYFEAKQEEAKRMARETMLNLHREMENESE